MGYRRRQRAIFSRRFLLNRGVEGDDLKRMAIARRFARTDRQLRPLYCDSQHKLMYDSEEIAQSTLEALRRVGSSVRRVYLCPVGKHFHLTTMDQGSE